MNQRAIFAIVRKDLKVVIRNKGIVIPIIIIMLFLFVGLPLATILIPSLINFAGSTANNIEEMIGRMPNGFQQQMAGLNLAQKAIVYFLVYMLAPMFMIVPLIAASVIAADSFAGEKERKTLEALLYTPTTDRELFTAKLLAGWLASIIVAVSGFVVYAIMVNVTAWPQMGRIFFPNAMWLVLITWVVPALPGLGLGLMVLVSSRAQGFQDANQIGGILVMPVLMLLFGQATGVMYFNVLLVFLIGLVIWVLDGLFIWLGSRSFKRTRIYGG